MWRVLSLAFVLAVAATGCGGDGDEDDADRPEATSRPTAAEPLAAAAERLERDLRGGDCRKLIRVMIHSIQRAAAPDAAPTRSDCRYIRTEARNQLRDYRVTKTREFGPAGFSEGTGASARKGEVIGIVWLVDSDRSWKAAFEATFRPQLGVEPERVEHADATARKLVATLRGANCAGLWRTLGVASRFVRGVDGRRAAFCRNLTKLYADPGSAFAQIKADARVTLETLGRTRDFSFYGIALRNGRYMDAVVSGPLAAVADAELSQHDNPSVLELLTVRQPG